MKRYAKKSPSISLAVTIRQFGDRFAAWVFLALAAALLFATTMNDRLATSLRGAVADVVVPVANLVVVPVRDSVMAVASVANFLALVDENERLREENLRLKGWYDRAMALQARNSELAGMTNLIEKESHSFITVRAFSDASGSFVRTILVAAGQGDGVKEDQAAIVPEGLVGRVVEVSSNSARILLLSDGTSRVPVFIEDSRTRAMLAGDNSDSPVLMHLPVDAQVKVGQRLVTSGHGGIFPPNIPVGIVQSVNDVEVRIKLFADLNHFEYIQIADYNLPAQQTRAKK